ncbi:MAG: flagellar hook-length control protein FliK, partial [Nitrosomonadales bacterium]|nr:flagellar hook-length control protein FliK [Nitrosomonadales bacterium]
GFPTPTFLLYSQLQSVSHTSISDTAQLINQFLNSSGNKKSEARFEAQLPITSSPFNPIPKIAGDLRQALVMSGLFYESHLAEFMVGKRPLSAILQEPHNQPATTLTSLVPQQLQILEQQRLLWHGEVWPRQEMEWEITRRDQQQDQNGSNGEDADAVKMDSKITLHLPRLGEVTANISYDNGRMRIELIAGKESTLVVLKQEAAKLVESMKASGQNLDQLTMKPHDSPAQP